MEKNTRLGSSLFRVRALVRTRVNIGKNSLCDRALFRKRAKIE